MCGICFICRCQPENSQPNTECQRTDLHMQHTWLDSDLLQHRGPDACFSHEISLCGNLQALLQGCVLHLRGELTPQPLVSRAGNILLWNGEIYDGLEVGVDENDTQVLLAALELCADGDSILHVLQRIHGPWAFIYWHATSKTLWFGRDMLGRRSLLWHLPETSSDHFVLSSVALGQKVYKEIPSVGIFSMDFHQMDTINAFSANDSTEMHLPELVLFPWKDCRWPGTDKYVMKTVGTDLMKYLYPDEYGNTSLNISVTVDTICKLNRWIPTCNQSITSETRLNSFENSSNDSQTVSNVCNGYLATVVNDSCDELTRPNNEQKEEGMKVPFFHEGSNLEKLLSQVYEERNDLHPLVDQCIDSLQAAIETRVKNITTLKARSRPLNGHSSARVAVLFSGGLDSTILAALLDRCLPPDEPIDLLNVAFEQPAPTPLSKPSRGKKHKSKQTRKKHPENSISGDNNVASSLLENKFHNGSNAVLDLDRQNIDLTQAPLVPVTISAGFHDDMLDASAELSNQTESLNERLMSSKLLHDNESVSSSITETYQDEYDCFSAPTPENSLISDPVSLSKKSLPSENRVNSLRDTTSSASGNLLSEEKETDVFNPYQVPDRETGRIALSELNPNRKWHFVEINVSKEELQTVRQSRINRLIYPLRTVLDDSIGCAVWFAARGIGVLGPSTQEQELSHFVSTAQIMLCGMAADELFAGYSRHRVTFSNRGWEGLERTIREEIWRISARNLGRDDRIIGDHGKEARFPFLDENFVELVSEIPLHKRINFALPRGVGEKLLLRLCALKLGLIKTSCQAKRAIQFGSKIAKLDKKKEKGSDVCERLV